MSNFIHRVENVALALLWPALLAASVIYGAGITGAWLSQQMRSPLPLAWGWLGACILSLTKHDTPEGERMLLNDRQIRDRAWDGMIDFFVPRQVREVSGVKVISYGLSSYGYDFRVGNKFKVFKPTYMPIVDPKAFSDLSFDEVEVDDHAAVIIPPNSFVLGESVERFTIPRDVLCVVLGKSTYARCGLILNVTPLEPEWVGTITLEISNTTPLPARVYAGEGIGQVLFLTGEPCETSYADKKGKYQNQSGVVGPKV